jgi:hypothetical protein
MFSHHRVREFTEEIDSLCALWLRGEKFIKED